MSIMIEITSENNFGKLSHNYADLDEKLRAIT